MDRHLDFLDRCRKLRSCHYPNGMTVGIFVTRRKTVLKENLRLGYELPFRQKGKQIYGHN